MSINLMTPTEKEIDFFSVGNKSCEGCKRHKKDLMLTYKSKNNPDELIDLFMDNKQAEELIKILKKTLEHNK